MLLHDLSVIAITIFNLKLKCKTIALIKKHQSTNLVTREQEDVLVGANNEDAYNKMPIHYGDWCQSQKTIKQN